METSPFEFPLGGLVGKEYKSMQKRKFECTKLDFQVTFGLESNKWMRNVHLPL